MRLAAKLPAIKVDADLQGWLDSQAASLKCDDVNEVIKVIQDQHPRYLRVSVCFAGSGQMETLGGKFAKYACEPDAECNAIAVMVRPKPAHLGYEALLVSGRRLDDFSPEALSAHLTNFFFSTCLHCGYQHPCEVIAAQRGIEMRCPKCKKVYGVLAADCKGTFRYVNEFLTGYQPPACYIEPSEKLDEMYTIWRAVVAHCTYVKDSTNPARKCDTWQTALETQCRQQGDCEDSALFLADWLISRGFQARVALGHFGDIGEHAWCVVRLENVDYLLESTEGPPDSRTPPYVSDVGARYVPETLFDRDAIYVRSHPQAKPGPVDYWAPDAWTRVRPRGQFQPKHDTGIAARAPQSPGPKLTVAAAASLHTGVKSSTVSHPSTAVSHLPFPSLGQVAAKVKSWEVLLPRGSPAEPQRAATSTE
jgi:phage FluMu protein Com